MVASLEQTLGAAVINVGGGGYAKTLESFLAGSFEERIVLQVGILAQMIFDRADPINYYRPYLADALPGPGTQVLVQEVIDDHLMPNITTEDLARAFSLPLVRPFADAVQGLEIVDPPVERRGLFQFDPARHGFLLANSEYPEACEAVRRQVTSFVSSYLADGTGVIEDPWP